MLRASVVCLQISLFFTYIIQCNAIRHFGDIYRKDKLRRNPHGVLRVALAGTGQAADTKTFRFYNKQTEVHRVATLPDIPYSIGEMYSGLLPTKGSDTSRQLFFVFQPTTGEAVDSLTIWLNGGPGCSSLEGLLQENGRFLWQDGRPTAHLNDHAWTNMTNMLWVEQPVGVGYTKGEPQAKTQEQSAREFLGFFKNFQDKFGMKNYKIYLTGESYAGRYVSYIGSAMLDLKNKEYFDLKGALMYDPTIGAHTSIQESVPIVPFLRDNRALVNVSDTFMANMEQWHNICGYDSHMAKYLTFPPPGIQSANAANTWDHCDLYSRAHSEITGRNACFDVYMANASCMAGADPIKGTADSPAYFQRDDVKAALHAPADAKWQLCTDQPVYVGGINQGPEHEGDLSSDPIQKALPKVIAGTNRVLIANGNMDMVILTNGTLLAIQNMTWNGQLGFQQRPSTPIRLSGEGRAGTQHYERGLLWSESFTAGHMGPEYAPELAYRQLEWLLGKRQTL